MSVTQVREKQPNHKNPLSSPDSSRRRSSALPPRLRHRHRHRRLSTPPPGLAGWPKGVNGVGEASGPAPSPSPSLSSPLPQAGSGELSVVFPVAGGAPPPAASSYHSFRFAPAARSRPSSYGAAAAASPPARSAAHRRAAASHSHPSKAGELPLFPLPSLPPTPTPPQDPNSSALCRILGSLAQEKKRWTPELEKKSMNHEAHPVIQNLQDLRFYFLSTEV
uniref:Uncharacterized protein n=1 Tax=Oryza sativa subsp. japonica TaxID=39947 RepID=Q6K668_ORYSJ|nr:hypothetical protein [Oryza sativa Japonica Group]BAD19674.1 hypothetical protein [Oryza sativa Japonica Group]